MELQFSKTDLGRLVRGDWELVCGPWKKGCADKAGRWLHIESDGLYLNNPENTPEPWVHPGREGLVLPLPTFTLEQFKSFCDWHPTFEWEAIESVFTNDDGTLDEDALKELASRGEAAAALARGVLLPHDDEYMRAWETHCQIDELRAEIAELKSLRPTTITERAIAKQELEKLNTRLTALQQPESASVHALPAQPQAQAAAPAPVVAESDSDALRAEEIPMKKKALIAALEHEWESIEADLSEATRNGLKDAAHASKHGEWYESKARAWAVSRGKIRLAAPAIHLAMWPGTVTRNRI